MGVNTFLMLSLAFASQFMLAYADNDTVCSYEGQRFRLDRQGQLPLETHYNCYTEIECKEKCDAKSTCIIWQWQPTRRICWIMDVVPYPDRNSDFGINNCDKGKPTENAPLCVVTKGDRNNVWQDYRGMTKEDCELECILDSDCLIWQHIRSKKLCRIHMLEIDLSKKSQVGIHYCSKVKLTFPSNGITCGLNRDECTTNKCLVKEGNLEFKRKHYCVSCDTPDKAEKKLNSQWKTGRLDRQHIVISDFRNTNENPIDYDYNVNNVCFGSGMILIYECLRINEMAKCNYLSYKGKLLSEPQKCEIKHFGADFKQIDCNIGDQTIRVYPMIMEKADCIQSDTKKKHICEKCYFLQAEAGEVKPYLQEAVNLSNERKDEHPMNHVIYIDQKGLVDWNQLENGKCLGTFRAFVAFCRKQETGEFECEKHKLLNEKENDGYKYYDCEVYVKTYDTGIDRGHLESVYCVVSGKLTHLHPYKF